MPSNPPCARVISEIKLPLNHSAADLPAEIIKLLAISQDLLNFSICKRSIDARNKSNIQLIYQVDAVLDKPSETALLNAFADQPFVKLQPDTDYHFAINRKTSLRQTNNVRYYRFWSWWMMAALITGVPIYWSRSPERQS